MHRRLGVGVAILVAVWFCLLPVFQAAHLAFADHDHVFCLEHHRIEDVPRKDASPRGTPIANAGVPGFASDLPDPEPRPHESCAILGLSVAQGSMVSPRQPPAEAGADDRPCPSPTLRREHLSGRPLLLSAPKTSPPLV